MKYNVGDRVRIKSIDWYNENKDEFGNIDINCDFTFYADRSKYCGKVFTISEVFDNSYFVKEDNNEYYWSDEMIEGLVEEEIKKKLSDENWRYKNVFDHSQYPQSFECPDGYIFKDENGNVINAQKIVLEKKKKEVILTQEQIDTMVHESCVLFCKHCGCGVPRETCTSLGSCKDHDEYRKSMRKYFEKHKN